MRIVSIQKKITLVTAAGILFMVVLLTGIGVFMNERNSSYYSDIMLEDTCAVQGLRIDSRLSMIRQSVQDILFLAEDRIPSAGDFTDRETMKDFTDSFQDAAVRIASNTSGAVAVYYRLNPELTKDGKSGFFWTKNPDNGIFEKSPMTDLEYYDSYDDVHVGWFHIPAREKKSVWLPPYMNQKIASEVISYVIPFYMDDDLLGVAGIDIDFQSIIDLAGDVKSYKGFDVGLVSSADRRIHYKENRLLDGTIPEDLYALVTSESNAGKSFSYMQNGMKSRATCVPLRNGMTLVLFVALAEINFNRNMMTVISLAVISACTAMVLFFILRMTKKMTQPISDILNVTREYSAGNWDARIECNTNDELKVLCDSIMMMAGCTKKYIGTINEVAFKDGLTGVKNKSSFIEYIKGLQDQVDDGDVKFAVIVFDINKLRDINGNFGHETGDKLLKGFSKLVCRHFSHSPVFRVGGDEFVVIADGSDYNFCRKILEDVRNSDRKFEGVLNGVQADFASGMAFFPNDGSSFDRVFEAAESRMKEDKMKFRDASKSR